MEDNILDYVYPLNFISRLFALGHFTSEFKQLSKPWVAYSILLVLLMNCLSFYQMILEISDKNSSKLFKFVSFLRIVSPMVANTSICFVFILKHKLFLHFLACLPEIEKVIQKGLGIPLPKGLYVKFQSLLIFVIVTGVGVNVFLGYILYGLTPAVLKVFEIISYLCQAQFIGCVLLLNQYITIISDQLCQLGKMEDASIVTRTTQGLGFTSKHEVSRNVVAVLDEHKKEEVINLCKELVRYISIIKEDLNSFFSFPILLVIADNLLITTFSLYMLIKNISLVLDSDEYYQQIGHLYTVSMNVIQVVYIAFPCATADGEIHSAASFTHKLINSKTSYLKSELVLLSKQLLHVEMVYTACGFFTLNESLLTSVFGAISTQLVILLQFQMSSSNQTETS